MPSSILEQSKLLNTTTILGSGSGHLTLAEIPSEITPNWLLPTSLIMTVLDSDIDTEARVINWQNQELATFNLCESCHDANKIAIIESMADPYRIAIYFKGVMSEHKVRITDIKDAEEDTVTNFDYLHQDVILFGKMHCMIPALDKLSHELVDLDR